MPYTFRAAGLALLGMVLIVSAVSAQDAARISVTPTSGNQFTTFVFTSSGFAPGTQLREIVTDTAGQQYTLSSNGQPAVVAAGNEGSFQVTLYPATDWPDVSAGTWLVSFCVVGDTSCFSGDTIDISA